MILKFGLLRQRRRCSDILVSMYHGNALQAQKLGGADHVLEIGGAGTFPEALKALNEHGSIGVIGLLEGRSPSF